MHFLIYKWAIYRILLQQEKWAWNSREEELHQGQKYEGQNDNGNFDTFENDPFLTESQLSWLDNLNHDVLIRIWDLKSDLSLSFALYFMHE